MHPWVGCQVVRTFDLCFRELQDTGVNENGPVPPEIHTGSCLCGGVRYTLSGPLRDVTACHCGQCRKTSGHHVAMTSVPSSAVTLASASSLRWYRSSETAERGFCAVCGGNLFWREIAGDTTSVTAGTLDPPTRLCIDRHIFVEDKSDYYSLHDAAAQFAGTDHITPPPKD